MQVSSLISSLKTYHTTLHPPPPLVTGIVHSCAISTPRRAYCLAAVSAHWTYRTHCYLCPTRYSFSPESSEAFEGEVPCPRAQHLNNVPRLRGEKRDIFSENSAPSGIRNRTAGSDIGKAPRSNHCAMPLSVWELHRVNVSCLLYLYINLIRFSIISILWNWKVFTCNVFN